jgi:hypothetical protein
MRMTRAAPARLSFCLPLSMALLLAAAGSSAFAQAADMPAATEAAASAPPAPVAPASRPPLAKAVAPSALSVPPAQWSGLTPKQQALLAPLERDWPEIAESQRSKWLSATPTLATMSGEEIKRVHDRMRDWARLSQAERLNARISFQVTRQLTPEQRQARWEAYQALPAEERRALAEKARARRQAQAGAAARPPKKLAPPPAQPASAPRLAPPTLVTGSLVQAKPGATTVLITRDLGAPGRPAAAPLKLAPEPGRLDPKTLLPRPRKAPPASSPRP